MKLFPVATAVLAAVSVLAVSGAQALSFTNGSFEGTPNIGGWTVSANTAWEITSVPAQGIPGPEDGSWYFIYDFDEIGGPNPGTLSQSFTDTPGERLEVSFWYYAADAYGITDNSLTARFDGTSHFSMSAIPTSSGWQEVTFEAIGTGSDTLEFDFHDTYGAFGFDNVSVAEVPEPATWALMLAGFAGLGAALRGRRRPQAA